MTIQRCNPSWAPDGIPTAYLNVVKKMEREVMLNSNKTLGEQRQKTLGLIKEALPFISLGMRSFRRYLFSLKQSEADLTQSYNELNEIQKKTPSIENMMMISRVFNERIPISKAIHELKMSIPLKPMETVPSLKTHCMDAMLEHKLDRAILPQNLIIELSEHDAYEEIPKPNPFAQPIAVGAR